MHSIVLELYSSGLQMIWDQGVASKVFATFTKLAYFWYCKCILILKKLFMLSKRILHFWIVGHLRALLWVNPSKLVLLLGHQFWFGTFFKTTINFTHIPFWPGKRGLFYSHIVCLINQVKIRCLNWPFCRLKSDHTADNYSAPQWTNLRIYIRKLFWKNMIYFAIIMTPRY